MLVSNASWKAKLSYLRREVAVVLRLSSKIKKLTQVTHFQTRENTFLKQNVNWYCNKKQITPFSLHQGLLFLLRQNDRQRKIKKCIIYDPSIHLMDQSDFIVWSFMENSIGLKWVIVKSRTLPGVYGDLDRVSDIIN